jgi:hypothetical protein
MSVCSERWVLSGRGLCDELMTRPEVSYRLWCFVVCDLETSWMRRPWPTGRCYAKKKKRKKVFYVSALCNTADVKASIHFRFLIWQRWFVLVFYGDMLKTRPCYRPTTGSASAARTRYRCHSRNQSWHAAACMGGNGHRRDVCCVTKGGHIQHLWGTKKNPIWRSHITLLSAI